MPPSSVRRSLLFAAFALSCIGSAHAQAISRATAVDLAEKFIARNGYTNLSRQQVSPNLDSESLELDNSREKTLERRFNTLKPKAIGIKKGARGRHNGWSVAFEYAKDDADSRTCRVVTMDEDGKNMVVQHVDGIRSYFAGFD